MPVERIMPDGSGNPDNPTGGTPATTLSPEEQLSLARRMAEGFVNYDAMLNQAADEQRMTLEQKEAFLLNARPGFLQIVLPELAQARPVTGPRAQAQQEQVAAELANFDEQIRQARQRGIPTQQLRQAVAQRNQLAAQHGLPQIQLSGEATGRTPRTPEGADIPGFTPEDDNVDPRLRREREHFEQLQSEVRNSLLPHERQILEDPNASQDEKNRINEKVTLAVAQRQAMEYEAMARAQRGGREETLEQRKRDVMALLNLREDEMEEVPVITQSGIPEVRAWPKSPENKIKYFRLIMNDIEGNFAEESTGTHRQKLNEIFEVVPALQQNAEAAKKQLGGQMFEELTRRLVMHQSYMKFATASDANGAMEGAGGLYDLVQNVLMRDLDHDFYKYYEETDPNDPNNKEKWLLTPHSNKNLKVWYSFNWYHRNADRIRNTAQDEQGILHDELKQFLQDKMGLDEVDATSSQLIGQRMWEITLRRAIEDELINTDTREEYDLTTKEGWDKLEKDAKDRKVDFKGKVSGGTFYARRALLIADWLQTQKENYRLRDKSINMVNNIDFNARDMFAHIPGDLEGYYKEELVKIYKDTPLTVNSQDQRWDNNSRENLKKHEGKSTQDPRVAAALAAEEAKVITEAIIGTRKNKGGNSWAQGSELIDFSNLIFNLEDFNELKRMELQKPNPDQEYLNELDRRRGILEQYQYNENLQISDIDQIEDPTARANAKISQHFKEGYFDFKRVRRPAQMIPSAFKGPEDVRGVLTSKDGPLRNPSPNAVVKLGETLSYMNAGQFGRSLQLIKNYIDYERTGGRYRQTGISNEQAEILINEMGMKLEMTLEEIAQAKHDLIWSEELSGLKGLGYSHIINNKDKWVKDWGEKAEAARADGNEIKAKSYENMQKIAMFFGDMYPDIILFAHELRKSTITKASVWEFFTELIEGIWKEIAKEKYV